MSDEHPPSWNHEGSDPVGPGPGSQGGDSARSSDAQPSSDDTPPIWQAGSTGWQAPYGQQSPAEPGRSEATEPQASTGIPATGDTAAGAADASYGGQGDAAWQPGGTSAYPGWQSGGTSAYPAWQEGNPSGYSSWQPADTGAAPPWQTADTAAYSAVPVPPGAEPTAPSGRRPRTGLILLLAAIVGLLAGGVGGYVAVQTSDEAASNQVVLPQTEANLSERPSGSVADIAAQVSPAVVSLVVDGAGGSGTGSGFVIRSDGYILTNNHVVESAAQRGTITAQFSDNRKLDATIVGRDAASDLAVVKVDAEDLPTVVLGNSDGVVVGDLALAIGSPLGLQGTVTSGIVSALNRPVTAGGGGETSFINAIQTDAASNPGNSGGPLVNAAGEVIGVNSAIATLSDSGFGQSGSIGLGFAIPVNQAKRIAEELISTGQSTTPIIGVRLDLRYTGDGALVQSVTSGGPADEAGMQDGDVIVAFEGQPIATSDELVVQIRSKSPGDEVTLTVERDGERIDLQITLGADSTSD